MAELDIDIQRHIEQLNECTTVENGRIKVKAKYDSSYGMWEDYANSTEANRLAFGVRNPQTLTNLYNKKIDEYVDIILAVSADIEDVVVSTLELMRNLVAYDFLLETDNATTNGKNRNYGKSLAGAGIMAALTGRGICQNQASFTKDILTRFGIDARFLALSGPSGSHADVLIQGKYVIDPTNFNGTLSTISGPNHLVEGYKLQDRSLNGRLDKEKFEKTIRRTQEELIKVLEIDKLSTEAGLEHLNDDAKQMIIWELLAKKLVKKDRPENSYTAQLGNFEVDVERAVELFYIHNNIPFTKDSRYICGYIDHQDFGLFNVRLNNQSLSICPRMNINLAKDFRPTLSLGAYTSDLKSFVDVKDIYLRAKQKQKNVLGDSPKKPN